MVLERFDQYQNYMKQRKNLQGSIGLGRQKSGFGEPPMGSFQDHLKREFSGGTLKVLDRTTKYGANPVQRPMQPGQFEQMKAMLDMHQQRPPMSPWGYPQGPWGTGPPMNYMPQMDHMYGKPFQNPPFESARNQNYFMGNRMPRVGGGGQSANRQTRDQPKGIQDDAGIENSEMNTQVSELERMIDLIEKANTQISSLISQSQIGTLDFKKKVSMCSANPDTSRQKQNSTTRITRSVDLGANARKIKELKIRFETLTRKTISQLNVVVPGGMSETLETQAHASYNYTSGKKVEDLRKMEKLQGKLDELSRKRTRDLDRLRSQYKANCANLESDFRALFAKMSDKKKELEQRVTRLKREKDEGLTRIQAMIEATKQKEIQMVQIRRTLLLSKKEVEGIGQRAQEMGRDSEDRCRRAEEDKERLEQEVESLRAELVGAQAQVSAERERADELEKRLHEKDQQVETVRVQLKAKEAVLQDRIREEERLKSELSREQARGEQSSQFEKDVRRLERDNGKLRSKAQDAAKKAEKLRKKNQRQDELIDEYEKELTQKNEKVLGLTHELEEVRREAAQTQDKLNRQVEELHGCVAEMEQAVAQSVDVIVTRMRTARRSMTRFWRTKSRCSCGNWRKKRRRKRVCDGRCRQARPKRMI